MVLKTASGAKLGMETNSSPAVADWNGDGLLDILVGAEGLNDGGLIKLFVNKGTATDYSFEEGAVVKTSDGQAIKDYERIRIQVVDLNYDGKLDLVMGEGWNTSAGFLFFENTGTTTEASLKQPVKLKKTDGSNIAVYLDAGPCFADWNDDGGLDLIAAGKGDDRGIDLYFGDVMTEIIQEKQNKYSLPLVGNCHVIITDVKGRQLATFSSKGMASIEKKAAALPAGIKLIQISSGTNKIIRKIFVK